MDDQQKKPTRLVRRAEAARRLGVSFSTLRRMDDVKPVQIGPGSIGYVEAEIEAAIDRRVAARDAKQSRVA